LIDIHCHLLPGIDDGSKSWEMTMEMYRMAAADGTTHIVATPHANYEYIYDRDFHLSYENVAAALEHPERYTIGSTNYLLVELSDFSAFNVADTLYRLRSNGLTPIVTHPERNPVVLSNAMLIDEFLQVGALMQITANSLTGSWGKSSQKFAETMLKKGQVHFIASDAHGLRSRPPILSAAREAAAKIIGAAAALDLVESNPAAVVSGAPLPQTTR